MRKLFWTFALLALPYLAMHACSGDDTKPPGSAGAGVTSAAATTGSGGRPGATTTGGTTTGTGTGGTAGRGG